MKTINAGPALEDRLISPDYPYESKAEADIAKMLDSYGIPFFYKQPTLVIENGKRCIEYADFFLPTYNGLAIDYIIESNSAIYRRKKNVYQDNQIPAVLITPTSSRARFQTVGQGYITTTLVTTTLP